MNKNQFFTIDETTWNDLDMDRVLSLIDSSESSVGKEYIASSLHNLSLDPGFLNIRNDLVNCISENEKSALSIRRTLKDLGKIKKFSFFDYIFRLKELDQHSNLPHYILILLLCISIALIFIVPAIGIIALVVIIALNIVLYFRYKAGIEGYFICLKYLVSMVKTGEKLLKNPLLKTRAFSGIQNDLSGSVKTFSGLKRGSWLLTNSISGSITDVILDYIRMITHIDLIKFNLMQKKALEKEEDIRTLYDSIGEIELCLSIDNFRKGIHLYCLPELDQNKKIAFEELYHPCIKKPVSNDLETERSVLLTGSNASGKSTFLKSTAINQILAQTIYTCCAKSFRSDCFKVISSMALKDNLQNNESYFVVEIKSIKRIFNEISDVPILCFVDEVLRGTNTAERIAASSQILKKLSMENVLVFAATHDMELTQILSDHMENYHFTEQVTGDSVIFDYKIKPGSATSKNAVKLLKMHGFDADIVCEAEKMADQYTR